MDTAREGRTGFRGLLDWLEEHDLNLWVVIGTLLSTGIYFFMLVDAGPHDAIALVMGGVLLVMIGGAALIAKGWRKTGAYLVLVGSAVYLIVLVGIIGVIGAYRTIKREETDINEVDVILETYAKFPPEVANSALMAAAYNGDTGKVVVLVAGRAADPDFQDSFGGHTPLMQAAYRGNLDIVRYLLEKGADLRKRSKNGMTVLHSAVAGGHVAVARFLIEKGLDVNAADHSGRTALKEATEQQNEEMVAVLKQAGARG